MAAILCRVCFVEPCKAMAKCCEGCCSCLGNCCECFGKCIGSCCEGFAKCCDQISLLCDKPFSGCVFTSFSINFVALLWAIIAIVSGSNQCDKPLLILGILLIVCTLINALFSYYMYRTINHDENNPLFNKNGDQDLKPSTKLYEFFKYDKWMAVYIIFVLILIGLLCVSIVMGGTCKTDIGRGVFWVSILLFIYLGVAILILFSYVAFDAFKEWAGCCPCWLLPFCWPCLLIGCCLNCADDMNESLIVNDKKNKNRSGNNKKTNTGKTSSYTVPSEQTQTNQYQQPVATEQPVVVNVVQQPIQIEEAQPQPTTQTVGYTQPPPQQQQQVMVTQPVQIQPTQTYQQPGYNPQGQANGIQPGVLIVNQPQQIQPVQENKNDEIDYDGLKQELKEQGKKAAAAAGKQAKKAGVKALGWMAKKMNELNEKVQEDETAKAAPQEGDGSNQKTY